MFNKKLALLVVLGMFCGLLFAAPAAAKSKGRLPAGRPPATSYTGTEIFVKFIDQGKTTVTRDGRTILRGQTIVNFKYSTDDRLIGINTITFGAVFDTTGAGPAAGRFRIQAGTFEGQASMTTPPMVYSEANPCGNAPKARKQCYQYEPQFYGPNLWLVFYPNGGGWQGAFTSTLAGYGTNPLTGRAEGFGTGRYGGLRVSATSNGYTYSGTIQ